MTFFFQFWRAIGAGNGNDITDWPAVAGTLRKAVSRGPRVDLPSSLACRVSLYWITCPRTKHRHLFLCADECSTRRRRSFRVTRTHVCAKKLMFLSQLTPLIWTRWASGPHTSESRGVRADHSRGRHPSQRGESVSASCCTQGEHGWFLHCDQEAGTVTSRGRRLSN